MKSALGGAAEASELEVMVARRIALLDTELTFLEDKIGMLRAEGKEPDPKDLDLYSRLTNTHRRQSEVLGFERRMKDVTPHSAIRSDR